MYTGGGSGYATALLMSGERLGGALLIACLQGGRRKTREKSCCIIIIALVRSFVSIQIRCVVVVRTQLRKVGRSERW